MAVKAVVPLCELLLVVGSQNSSNSGGWWKFARMPASGVPGGRSTVKWPEWLEDVGHVAVTAGASAPENLVQELIEFLRDQRVSRNWKRWKSRKRTCAFICPPNSTRRPRLPHHRTVMSPPSSQFADALRHSLRRRRAARLRHAYCSSTGDGYWWASSPPIPLSNPITSCCSCGCIRRGRRLESAHAAR